MQTGTMHPQPSPAAVWMEELRAVGLGMRREVLAAVLAGVAGVVVLLVAYARAPLHEKGEFALAVSPVFGLPAILVALLFPLLVWRREGVGRRDYLWSMPLDRGSAHLAKAGSAWLWLLALLVIYLLGLCALALAMGGEVGVHQVVAYSNVPGSIVPPRPGATVTLLSENFYRVSFAVPAWQWLVPFVGATIAYLFGSSIVIGARHPYVWGVAVWGVFMFIASLSNSNLGTASRLAHALLEGRYGLGTLLTGDVPYYTRVSRAGGEILQSLSRVPDGGAWLAAVALWGVPVVAAFLLVLRRHRES